MCFLYRCIADIILLLPEKVKQIRSMASDCHKSSIHSKYSNPAFLHKNTP